MSSAFYWRDGSHFGYTRQIFFLRLVSSKHTGNADTTVMVVARWTIILYLFALAKNVQRKRKKKKTGVPSARNGERTEHTSKYWLRTFIKDTIIIIIIARGPLYISLWWERYFLSIALKWLTKHVTQYFVCAVESNVPAKRINDGNLQFTSSHSIWFFMKYVWWHNVNWPDLIFQFTISSSTRMHWKLKRIN